MQIVSNECRAFLLEQAYTGKIATIRPDGRPHVAPIWFALDGETLVFNTGDKTVKAVNIRYENRVCLCVDNEKPPFSFAIIEGIATLSNDMTELKHWATLIAGRYMGEEQAEVYGKRNAVPGELTVRIHPTKVIFQKNVSD